MVMGVAPLLVVFGGIYHWFPKVTGRMLRRPARPAALLDHLPRHLPIYFPMHYLGVLGMPRRYYNFDNYQFIPPSAHTLNAFITVVALIVGVAQLLFIFNLVWSAFRGRPADANPWRAASLEWQTPHTPPVHGNWGPQLPVVYRWAYAYGVPGAREDFIAAERAARARRAWSPSRTARAGRGRRHERTSTMTQTVSATAADRPAPHRRSPRSARRRHRPVGVHRRGDRAVLAVPRRLRDAHERRRLPSALALPWQLWLSTALLVAGSVALQRARSGARDGAMPTRTRAAAGRRRAARWPSWRRSCGPGSAAGRAGDCRPAIRRQLLLPADGDARAARGRRPGRLGVDGARRLAPRAARRARLAHRAVRALLAFPAGACGWCCSPLLRLADARGRRASSAARAERRRGHDTTATALPSTPPAAAAPPAAGAGWSPTGRPTARRSTSRGARR